MAITVANVIKLVGIAANDTQSRVLLELIGDGHSGFKEVRTHLKTFTSDQLSALLTQYAKFKH
jgi:hypothetical protein